MKKLFYILLLLIPTGLVAQLKVGNNPTTINNSALLEMESTNKGLLPPRMTTAQRDAITNPATSLVIFNTDLNCLQMNLGTPAAPSWQCLIGSGNTSSNGSAVVSAYSCNTASTGNLNTGQVVNGVTQTITATVTTPGMYNITAASNGVTFSGIGTFTGTGAQAVVLTATGIPTASVTATFTLNTTPGCSFTRTANANDPSTNGTAVVSGFNCNTASAGALIVGAPAAGVTQTITATVVTAGTYNITTSANGVTFSGSGTFAGTGPQNVVLTATGTPLAAGTATYTLNTTPGCSFTRLSVDPTTNGTGTITLINCAAAATGQLTVGQQVSGVTQTITVNVLTTGTYNINTNTVNGVSFSGNGSFTATGSQNIVLTATGTPSAATTSTYTLNTTPSCGFNQTAANQPSSGGSALVSGYACSTASAGTLITGTAVSGVTQTITATVTTAGTYNIAATANGVTFTGTGTFAATGAQNVVLTATGTPTLSTTATYTLSTTPGCSFTRASAGCAVLPTAFSASPITVSGGQQTFAITAPAAGKFILIGSADVWLNGSAPIAYQVKNGSTVLADNSFIAASTSANNHYNIPTHCDFSVASAGTYNIDFVMTSGTALTAAKLQYIFIPSGACAAYSVTTGILNEGTGSVNNTPAANSHRFAVTASGAGRFLLFSKLNMYTVTTGNSLTYQLKNGSTVLATGLQQNPNVIGAYQGIVANGYLDVASSGTYNIDIEPQTGFNGVTNPHLYWIFVPSGSNITSGTSSAATINNGAGTRHLQKENLY